MTRERQWDCPRCGEVTDRCYRCSECGADIAGKVQTHDQDEEMPL